MQATAQALVDAQAQAVLWIGSAQAVAAGVQALRALSSSAQVVTVSNNASAGFVALLGEHARGVIVTQVFRGERASGQPMVREAQQLALQKGLQLSPAMLEGYAAAKVLVQALRRAGPHPDRARLQEALASLREFDIGGGLRVDYAPDDRTGLDFVELSIVGRDGRFAR